ncbi:hypothetical protein EJ02DRAFT_72199 [Clathrospora elynae]|uniref:Uncharacterized protein n=1 Tax=Clathrospora elynae TaxID=706981 RepID=A0A6A5T789_9PLEO|nr:hypothetical protein EJ02DRAFT_72199 [Clathrospora elynae]
MPRSRFRMLVRVQSSSKEVRGAVVGAYFPKRSVLILSIWLGGVIRVMSIFAVGVVRMESAVQSAYDGDLGETFKKWAYKEDERGKSIKIATSTRITMSSGLSITSVSRHSPKAKEGRISASRSTIKMVQRSCATKTASCHPSKSNDTSARLMVWSTGEVQIRLILTRSIWLNT